MKAIAILSNGPSLSEYWSQSVMPYDIILGINTAAWLYPVDIWCFLDPDIVHNIMPEHPLAQTQQVAADTPLYQRSIPIPDKIATYEGNPGAERLPESQIIKMPWYGNTWQRLKLDNAEGLLNGTDGKCATGKTFPNALSLAAELSDGGQVDIYGMDITTQSDVAGFKGDRSAARWKDELPWIKAAWQPHWRIFGNASEPVRQYILGKIPYKELHKTTISEMRGGKTYYK